MRALHTLRELIKNPEAIFWRFKLLGEARVVAKRWLAAASRVVWRKPLDRESTIDMLGGNEVRVADDVLLHLPNRIPFAGEHYPPIFGEWDVIFDREYVWRLEQNDQIRSMRITPTGTLLLNRKCLLDTDFGSVQGVGHLPLRRLKRHHIRRQRVPVDVAIAPWSHGWATYYEFVVHILSKLCWMREVVDPALWAGARVCYPLRDTSFERQYLTLLGVKEDDLLDTEFAEPIPRTILVSNLQRGSRLINRTRVSALRNAFLSIPSQTKSSGRRIYLSREGFSRRVLNEAEVRRVVSSYGLEIIEPHLATVEEQIRLFSEASLIVAPHGSALTNLVWCSPGTSVIELFSRSYLSHLFSYISLLLDLRHTYLVDDAPQGHHWTNKENDILVDIPTLAQALENVGA